MAIPFIPWWGIVVLAWLVLRMVKRKTLDAVMGLGVTWTVFFTAPFFIPQIGWPLDIEIGVVTTVIMVVLGIIYFRAQTPAKLVVAEPDLKHPITELRIRFLQGGDEKVCKGQFHFVKVTNHGGRAVEKLQFFAYDHEIEGRMRIVLLEVDPAARACITADYKGAPAVFEEELEKDETLPFAYALIRATDSDRAIDHIEELRPDKKRGITFLLAFILKDDVPIWFPAPSKMFTRMPCTLRVVLECEGKDFPRRSLATYEIVAPSPELFTVKLLERSHDGS